MQKGREYLPAELLMVKARRYPNTRSDPDNIAAGLCWAIRAKQFVFNSGPVRALWHLYAQVQGSSASQVVVKEPLAVR